MDGINYEPLIRDMTWSYSRLKTYDDCPYRWYLKYIRYPKMPGKDMFFSGYGKLMHELIADVYSGRSTPLDAKLDYLRRFRREVKAPAPSMKVFQSYFQSGSGYFDFMKPSINRILAVEEKNSFSVDGIPFIGFIDLQEETPDGELHVIDHKSRTLKARSSRKKPTQSDLELDQYLVQLYLYSIPVIERAGKTPSKLCFNCFRSQLRIEEPFIQNKFEDAKRWAVETVGRIAVESEFLPSIEYFKCRYLCEMQDVCDYYRLYRG